jgi:hypothetical protein
MIQQWVQDFKDVGTRHCTWTRLLRVFTVYKEHLTSKVLSIVQKFVIKLLRVLVPVCHIIGTGKLKLYTSSCFKCHHPQETNRCTHWIVTHIDTTGQSVPAIRTFYVAFMKSIIWVKCFSYIIMPILLHKTILHCKKNDCGTLHICKLASYRFTFSYGHFVKNLLTNR